MHLFDGELVLKHQIKISLPGTGLAIMKFISSTVNVIRVIIQKSSEGKSYAVFDEEMQLIEIIDYLKFFTYFEIKAYFSSTNEHLVAATEAVHDRIGASASVKRDN